MAPLSRRDMLKSGLLASAGIVTGTRPVSNVKEDNRIPLFHITDLYHAPQDPDDQIDLATVFSLPEYDVKGIGLDVTRKFLDGTFDFPRDPGFIPVSQLSYLTGKSIPTGMGPIDPLTGPLDTAQNRPRTEQTAINLLLDILQESPIPVVISITGSARILTAAFNREPDLVSSKTKSVLLNAGSTGGPKIEWNVMLDTEAYVGVWKSGLPIDWYPCSTESGAFSRTADRATYFQASHRTLFENLSPSLRAWMHYTIAGSSRGDFIRALHELGTGATWTTILEGSRNMWATASLVLTAGRVLRQTDAGWRFVQSSQLDATDSWPMLLDPISATTDETGRVEWMLDTSESRYRLFRRRPGREFGDAMTEALGALLADFSSEISG